VPRLFLIVTLVAACALAPAAAGAAKEKAPLPCKVKGSKTYPGDDAPKVELAKWMAEGAVKARLPAELPVMAALVESNLTNLNFGDSDAVGFFQMRVGIWNQGDYAGFPDHPELQLKWFVDQALLVEQRRVAEGFPLDVLLRDETGYGSWVADVQRPAEEYRGRYQLQLENARALICA